RKLHNTTLRQACYRQERRVESTTTLLDLGRWQLWNPVHAELPRRDFRRREVRNPGWVKDARYNISGVMLVRGGREPRRLIRDVIPRRELVGTASLGDEVRALHAVGRLGQGMVTDVLVRGRLRQHLKVYRRVLL